MEKVICSKKNFKHDLGNIVVRTMDKKNCTSCCINLETYIVPTLSLEESIDMIRRKFKANMSVIGNTYFDSLNGYLLTVDFNQTKGKDKPGKRSFIDIEFTLYGDFEWDDDFAFTCSQFADTYFCLLETLDFYFSVSPSAK